MVLGNEELWRIDPTGQFWKCQATAVGRNGDKAEEVLFQRLQSESKGNEKLDVCSLIQDMSTEDALSLLVECLELTQQPKLQDTKVESTPSMTFWQAVIQDHETRPNTPRRQTIRRGSFLPRNLL